jgi:hypothetical protein
VSGTDFEIELPEPYPKQREAIWSPKRIAVIEASTKVGKTAGCIFWILEQAMTNGAPGRNFWWVAPIFPQAKIAFSRIITMLMLADREKRIWSSNVTEMFITLAGRGTIWFKSADKPDSLYGEDVYAAVIDEATRCSDEAWYALRSTLTFTRGPVRIIGNVRGRDNWVRRMKTMAENGDPEISYHKLTAWDAVDAGVLEREEVERAKMELPDHIFKELYLAEPAEDGGNPFGLAHIEACVGPLSEKDVCYWGIDLAKGIGPNSQGDHTVLVGLDEDGHVCQFDRFTGGYEDVSQRVSNALTMFPAPALVDSTGVGGPIYEQFAAAGLPVEPYPFSNQSKQVLMGTLATAIRMREVVYPDNEIKSELLTYEYEYLEASGMVRYSAPKGKMDDCVCALALAVFLARKAGRGHIGVAGREAAKAKEKISVFDWYKNQREDPDWGFN